MSWRNLVSFGDLSGMSKQSRADRTETLSDFRKNQLKRADSAKTLGAIHLACS
jgi:hypothetical protein